MKALLSLKYQYDSMVHEIFIVQNTNLVANDKW